MVLRLENIFSKPTTMVETTNTMVGTTNTMVKIDCCWKLSFFNRFVIVSDNGLNDEHHGNEA